MAGRHVYDLFNGDSGMTHNEITNGLQQLGFVGGWVVTGDEITVWENGEPQPTAAAIKTAATQWATTVAAKEAATAAAKLSAQTKLAALGLTPAEIAAL